MSFLNSTNRKVLSLYFLLLRIFLYDFRWLDGGNSFAFQSKAKLPFKQLQYNRHEILRIHGVTTITFQVFMAIIQCNAELILPTIH